MKFSDVERFHRSHEPAVRAPGGRPLATPAVQGIDLFLALSARSISGWMDDTSKRAQLPTSGNRSDSQLEERFLRLGSNITPQVVSYARGNIGTPFATTYRLLTPKHAPFAIGYAFEQEKNLASI
jgi:hypothetical protein